MSGLPKSVSARRNATALLETLGRCGVRLPLVEIEVPASRAQSISSFGVESTAFFEKHGKRMTTAQGRRRMGGRLIPAV
eukprot:SAG22_NODE_12137_length_455_cov_0.721910_1_plen_78_part_10